MIHLALAVAVLVVPALAHPQAPEGALKRIRDTRTLTIAYRTDALPFSFADDKKQPAGYTIEICKRIAASLEQQLKTPGLKVVWTPATAQNRFELISKKRADMECGATTATLSRMEAVDFSNYVFVDSTGVLVRNDSGVKAFAGLAGRKVAAIAGTTNAKALNAALRKQQVNATVVTVRNRDEGFAALDKGAVDAFAGDKLLLAGLAAKMKDTTRYTILPDDLSVEPYAITLPRGDAGLRLAVNRALAQIYRSLEILEIFDRWFGALGKPSGLLEAVYFLGAVPE